MTNRPQTPISEREARGTWLVHCDTNAANPNGEAAEFDDYEAAVRYAFLCDENRENRIRALQWIGENREEWEANWRFDGGMLVG